MWSRKWQPTPVFLLGKFHEQRRLAGYSSWSLKELDTREQRADCIAYELYLNKAARKSNGKSQKILISTYYPPKCVTLS